MGEKWPDAEDEGFGASREDAQISSMCYQTDGGSVTPRVTTRGNTEEGQVHE